MNRPTQVAAAKAEALGAKVIGSALYLQTFKRVFDNLARSAYLPERNRKMIALMITTTQLAYAAMGRFHRPTFRNLLNQRCIVVHHTGTIKTEPLTGHCMTIFEPAKP